MKRKFGAFSSSVNPEELSLTVASAIKLFAVIIGTIGTIAGTESLIDDSQVETVIQAFNLVIAASYATYEVGQMFVGIARKFLAAINK